MHKKKTTPWARRRRRTLILCVVLALLFSPAVLWRLRLKSEVRQELVSLQAAGVPTTGEALSAWEAQFPELVTVGDYEKVGPVFVPLPYDVAQNLPSFRMRHESEALFLVPYDPQTLESMKQFTESNGETLRLLREGRAHALADSTAKRGQLGDNLSPMGGYEDIVALCCANICVKSEQGDGAGAVETVLDGLVLDKAIRATPWSQSLWVPTNVVEQLMHALASGASRVVLPESQLRAVQELLLAPNWEEETRLTRIHNIASMVVEFPSIQLDAPQARLADTVFGLFDQHMISSMRSERRRLELTGKSLAEQRAVIEGGARGGQGRDIRVSGPPVHLAVARLGIELICHYQNKGTLPESLEALATDGMTLDDFYSGKSLVYRPVGNGFTLYSVGRDLTDEGGSGRTDIVFRCQWPGQTPRGSASG